MTNQSTSTIKNSYSCIFVMFSHGSLQKQTSCQTPQSKLGFYENVTVTLALHRRPLLRRVFITKYNFNFYFWYFSLCYFCYVLFWSTLQSSEAVLVEKNLVLWRKFLQRTEFLSEKYQMNAKLCIKVGNGTLLSPKFDMQ